MTLAFAALAAAALLLGVLLGLRRSERDRLVVDKRIEDAMERSVRRTDAGMPALPIEDVYKERKRQ